MSSVFSRTTVGKSGNENRPQSVQRLAENAHHVSPVTSNRPAEKPFPLRNVYEQPCIPTRAQVALPMMCCL